MNFLSSIWGHLAARFHAGTSAAEMGRVNTARGRVTLEIYSDHYEGRLKLYMGFGPETEQPSVVAVYMPVNSNSEQHNAATFARILYSDFRPQPQIVADHLELLSALNTIVKAVKEWQPPSGSALPSFKANERTSHPNPASGPNSTTKEPA